MFNSPDHRPHITSAISVTASATRIPSNFMPRFACFFLRNNIQALLNSVVKMPKRSTTMAIRSNLVNDCREAI